MQYHWLEDGWPLEEEELKLSGRRLVRLMDWFLDGNQVMAYTVNMPGELIDENAEVMVDLHCRTQTRIRTRTQIPNPMAT